MLHIVISSESVCFLFSQEVVSCLPASLSFDMEDHLTPPPQVLLRTDISKRVPPFLNDSMIFDEFTCWCNICTSKLKEISHFCKLPFFTLFQWCLQGHSTALICSKALNVRSTTRLCSGHGFESRPRSPCCTSLPLSYPVSCHTLRLSCLQSQKRPKRSTTFQQ